MLGKFTSKRVLLPVFCSFLAYWFLLKTKKYTETFEVLVEVEPKVAWEYLADASNQHRLNPTILNYEIEYEKGNYDNWEYAVRYTEYSLSFPFVQYENRGIFNVLPQVRKKLAISKHYRILQDFNSCSLGYCLQTNAEILFLPNGEDSTRIEEKIVFECPPLISSLCFRDLRLQKGLIYDNIVSSL